MKNYEDMVEALAKSGSPDVIDNSSAEHAAILIKNMFNYATVCVDLFSGCLTKSVYERQDIKDAGRSFIARGGKVRILVQDENSDEFLKDHEFIRSVKSACDDGKDGNFTVSKLSPAIGKDIKAHFLVMDKRAYRYEPDKLKHEAVACFNNPDIALSLSGLFDALILSSSPVKFTQ